MRDVKFDRGRGRETPKTGDKMFPNVGGPWLARRFREAAVVPSDLPEIVSPPMTDIYGRLEILGVVHTARV